MALSLRNRQYEIDYDGTAAGEYIPEKMRQAKIDYLKKAEDQVGEEVWRKDEKNAALTLRQLVVVLLLATLCLATMLCYILSASSHSLIKSKVEKTQKTYFTLVSENARLENEIEKAVNYTAVYDYAINTLGMTYPEKTQILSFENNNKEYVVKGESIPEK